MDIVNLPVSTDSIDSFLSSVRSIPILTGKEEFDLFESYKNSNDPEIYRTIVLSNLRFVAYVAHDYRGYNIPREDVIQQGCVGLLKALNVFDHTRKVKFFSFAVKWIRAEILEYSRKNFRIAKISTTKTHRKLFYNLNKFKTRLGWLNKDEVDELATKLNVDPSDVLEMEQRLSNTDESFEGAGFLDDNYQEFNLSPSEYLSTGELYNPEAIVLEKEETHLLQRQMMKSFELLDSRRKDIIQSRWLNSEKSTLRELSTKHGVSMERIRQLEKDALSKMKGHIHQPV